MNPIPLFFRIPAVALCTLISLGGTLLAVQEEGSADSPVGVSGVFNGNSTTADSISSVDPWTGNFRRGEIVDVEVPGALGYGLRFARTYNSKDFENWQREIMVSGPLGNSMGQCWRHSYSMSSGTWGAPTGTGGTDWRNEGGLVFPDGRVILDPGTDPCQPDYGLPPTEESFDQGTHTWTLPDGGKVHLGHSWGWDFPGISIVSGLSADKITDPHGLEITIEHDTSCQNCGVQNRIKKVTEPGGKYLLFTYYDAIPGDAATIGLIKHVEAYDQNGAPLGLWAEYHYISMPNAVGHQANDRFLTQVDYSNGTHANYQWNFGNGNGHPPFIDTADDSHYAGPMRHIEYGRLNDQAGEWNQFGTTLVSEVNIVTGSDPVDGSNSNWAPVRTETRGDGATRTFTYNVDNYRASCVEGRLSVIMPLAIMPYRILSRKIRGVPDAAISRSRL
ncbi:MAG: DUF6531 domain-containing protein, partial [Verrucomicrobiota bacterium]